MDLRRSTGQRLGTISEPARTVDVIHTTDVLVVGSGPAGLAAAIRLKQLAAEAGSEIAVCVLEKGSEVGAHQHALSLHVKIVKRAVHAS